MADGDVAGEVFQVLLVEDLVDQAHFLEHADGAAVRACDPGALLASMLKAKKPEVRQASHVLPLGKYAEDATFFAGMVRQAYPIRRMSVHYATASPSDMIC